MKDSLGVEIEPGDLIADIRTGYHWNDVGIVHGGITGGGKIRYINNGGYKNNSQEKCLIKITPETFIFVHEKKLNELRQRYQDETGGRKDEWYDREIKLRIDGVKKVAVMRQQYGKEF